MAAFNEEQIGISKEDTVNAYLARDNEHKVDTKKTIEFSLNKLGYLNFHKHLKINQYINDRICQYIKNNIDVISGHEIESLKEKIKDDNKFKCFIDNLNNTENRVKDLSGFVGSSDAKAFYEALTLEELNYLGY